MVDSVKNSPSTSHTPLPLPTDSAATASTAAPTPRASADRQAAAPSALQGLARRDKSASAASTATVHAHGKFDLDTKSSLSSSGRYLGEEPKFGGAARVQHQQTLEKIGEMRVDRIARDGATATLNVDVDAMRENFGTMRGMVAPEVVCAAVLKADAYGLKAPRMGAALRAEGCKDFFVATLSEAIELRNAMHDTDPADKEAIFLLGGMPHGISPQVLIDHKITPVLNSLEEVAAWNEAGRALNVKLPAILQFDSGMSRAGMSPSERKKLVATKDESLKHINVLYLMSHLATSGDMTHDADHNAIPAADTEMQYKNFEAVRRDFPTTKWSLSASSGIFLGDRYHGDMVRAGGLIQAMAPAEADDNPLKPVIGLSTKVMQTRVLEKGDRVGYGLTWKAEKQSIVATASIGFADGLQRTIASTPNADGTNRIHAHGFVGEKGREETVPVIGKVSMDMTTFDFTHVSDPANLDRGTEIRLVSDKHTLDHFGNQIGTNAAELLTKITPRVYRNVKDSQAGKRAPENDPPSANAWALRPMDAPAEAGTRAPAPPLASSSAGEASSSVTL